MLRRTRNILFVVLALVLFTTRTGYASEECLEANTCERAIQLGYCDEDCYFASISDHGLAMFLCNAYCQSEEPFCGAVVGVIIQKNDCGWRCQCWS